MVEPCPVVFDISSDEEPPLAFDDSNNDDYNWLTELLDNVDRERSGRGDAAGDSDEVVIVEEYTPKSKPKSRKVVKEIVEDDDDCVVLDGDPDKTVAFDNDRADSDDGDDIIVVGQKGQIACRDYPHPRHDCAKFPFSSTPHDRHCDLCHCYVCDSLAPCAYWGMGSFSTDHCHATDKHETWKNLRENLRLQKKPSLPGSRLPSTPLPLFVSQANQVESPANVQLVPNLVLPNQVSRPTTFRPCSPIPNIISQGRNNQSGYIHGRSVLQPQSVVKQANGGHSNVVRRGTIPNIGDMGRKIVSTNTMFKRPGLVRCPVNLNQFVNHSPNNTNSAHPLQHTRNTSLLSTSTVQFPTDQEVMLSDLNLESYAHQCSVQSNIGTVMNTLPSQPEIYSNPISHSYDGQNIYQLVNQSHNVMNSGFSDNVWSNISSQRNLQPSVENMQFQGTGSNDLPSTINHFDSSLTGNTPFHYNAQEYENLYSSQPVSGASGGCLPTDPNTFSPEPPAIDAGMLYFDFETSFNGLAHA